MRMTPKQLEKYHKTMTVLEAVWNENLAPGFEESIKLHDKPRGIRSTQIGALVMLLIELEIIK